MWDSILHGDCGEYGDYKVISVLPDKISRYLFEFDSESYTSHNLPALPQDRSNIDVHSLLRPDQVKNSIMCIMYIMYIICIMCIIADKTSPGHP